MSSFDFSGGLFDAGVTFERTQRGWNIEGWLFLKALDVGIRPWGEGFFILARGGDFREDWAVLRYIEDEGIAFSFMEFLKGCAA